MTGVEISRNGDRARVDLGGSLTEADIPDLQPALHREIAAGVREMAFDMARTVSIDSSGIGLLLAAVNSIKRSRGEIRLLNVSVEIQALFRSLGLSSILHVTPADKDAVHG